MDEMWQGMLCCTFHAFYPRYFSWLPWLYINQAFVDTSQTRGEGYKSVPSLLYGDLEDDIGDDVLHLNSSPFPDFASICWATAAPWASLTPVHCPSCCQRCSQQQLVRSKASGLSGFSNWAVMASLPRIGSGKRWQRQCRATIKRSLSLSKVSGTASTTSRGQWIWKSEPHNHKSSSPGGAIHITRPEKTY